MKKTKYLIVVERIAPSGGAERQIVNLAIASQKEGYLPIIISFYPPGRRNQYMKELREAKIKTLSLPSLFFLILNLMERLTLFLLLPLFPLYLLYQRIKKRKFSPHFFQMLNFTFIYPAKSKIIEWAFILLLTLVRRIKNPSFVHKHKQDFLLKPTLYWCKRSKIPLIYTEHGPLEGKGAWRQREEVTSLLADFSIITVLTPHVKERAREIFGKQARIEITPNWIEDPLNKIKKQRKERRKSSIYTIFSCGRLEKVKGFDILLKGLALLGDSFPWECYIAGEGKERDALLTLRKTLGLEERVKFLGALEEEEILKYLLHADIVVLPSRSEGISMFLLTAMAMGKPVIATRVGGNPFLLTHQKEGILIPPEDPSSLATALRNLYSSPQKREELGKENRRRYEEDFTPQKGWERIERIYSQIVRKEKHTLSVIIPTRNRPEELYNCLKSISSQTHLPQEVIVVDSSEDKIKEEVQKVTSHFPSLNIRYLHTSPGLPHQKNVGVRNSHGEIVLFLDDDVLIEKNFIEEILKVFATFPWQEIGGVMGNDLNTERIPRWSLRYWLRQIFFLYNSGSGKFRLSGLQTLPFGLSGIRRTQFLVGGFTAYRKEVVEKIPPDEENFTFYPEDLDLSYRVSKFYNNYYAESARCRHLPSSQDRLKGEERRKIWIRDYTKFFKKNIPKNLFTLLAYRLAVYGIKNEFVYMTDKDILLFLAEKLLGKKFVNWMKKKKLSSLSPEKYCQIMQHYYRKHPEMVSSPLGREKIDSRLAEEIFSRLGVDLKEKRILDVGCGRGNISSFVEERGGKYVGMDITPPPQKIDFPLVIGDGQNIPFQDGTFDWIFCIDAFEHFLDPFRSVQEFRRVLKNKGRVFLSVPNYSNVQGIVKFLLEKIGIYPPNSWAPFGNWSPQAWEQFITPWRIKKIFRKAGFHKFKVIGLEKEWLTGIFPWIEHPLMPEGIKLRLQKIFAFPGKILNHLFPFLSGHTL